MKPVDCFDVTRPAPIILGTGLIALDVVYGPEPDAGPVLRVGGTCGNVLVILAYLGWTARPIARLNGDPAAKQIEQDFRRWGVRLGHAHLQPSGRTPVVVQRIEQDAEGNPTHRFSLTCPECGRWLPTYQPVPAQAVDGVVNKLAPPRVVFVDRVSRGAVALAESGREGGALVYFEPSARSGRALFRQMLEVAHVVKYSRERTEAFADVRPKGPHCALEIETLGRAGLRFRSAETGPASRAWSVLPGFTVSRLVDAAGAGDWCTAGIVHLLGQSGSAGLHMLSGSTLRSALRFGQALAAWTCGYPGARGGMYLASPKAFRLAVRQILAGASPVANCELASPPRYDAFAELCLACTAR